MAVRGCGEPRARRRALGRAARAALDRLSERDRDLLLLRQEGLWYRAIAGTLGVAPTSVGPLLARAQRRLLRALEAGERRERGREGGTSSI